MGDADAAHVPVLVAEALVALAVRPAGVYVDATFGRGGHSRSILALLGAGGRLIALDRDPAAAAAAAAIADRRFAFRRAWFSELPGVLAAIGVDRVDGVLMDLGVSSPQIDDPARGFSFRADGPLDMRMDPDRGESAAEFVARADVRDLSEVIRDHGEERFAKSIAGAIVAARAREPIVRTRQLAAIVGEAVGARPRRDWSQDPATRTFQALRIHVNRELAELTLALPRAVAALREGGRLVVISFHSLEDRIVKQFFAAAAKPWGGDARLARMPLPESALPAPPLALVGRAQKTSAAEAAANPRARSAILRAAERTAAPLPRGFAPAAGA